jgi:hypothetical protein
MTAKNGTRNQRRHDAIGTSAALRGREQQVHWPNDVARRMRHDETDNANRAPHASSPIECPRKQ